MRRLPRRRSSCNCDVLTESTCADTRTFLVVQTLHGMPNVNRVNSRGLDAASG